MQGRQVAAFAWMGLSWVLLALSRNLGTHRSSSSRSSSTAVVRAAGLGSAEVYEFSTMIESPTVFCQSVALPPQSNIVLVVQKRRGACVC